MLKVLLQPNRADELKIATNGRFYGEYALLVVLYICFPNNGTMILED